MAREGKKIGIHVVLEPQWKIAGQITTRTGKKRYFRSMALDLNTQGASAISTDKEYAAMFLKKMGYPSMHGKGFASPLWAQEIGSSEDRLAAEKYAIGLGFPIIVKPNSKSQGKGVFLVHNLRELRTALKTIFTYDRVALVQKRIIGRDYRIVALDGKIISAYERIPLSVLGDGRSNIKKLLAKKQREFRRNGRDTKLDAKDPRIKAKISRQGDTLASVPKKGVRVQLLENANLSSGGDAVDVTKMLHPEWRKLAARIAEDMHLRFTGIDVMLKSDLTTPPGRYHILEVNDSPGLDHYASIGPAQKKIVDSLYRAVLKAMAR